MTTSRLIYYSWRSIRVRASRSSHNLTEKSRTDVMGDTQEVLDFCLANDIKPQAYSPSAPVHKFADGPVDEVTARVAGELSTASGKEVNPGQVLLKVRRISTRLVPVTIAKQCYSGLMQRSALTLHIARLS